MHKILSLLSSCTICVSLPPPTSATSSSLLLLILLHIQLSFLSSAAHGDGCNEFVCGSVVSKCLLTQSCQCKLSDCYCCKDCLNCLGDLYTECCGCLDMCPKHNDTLSALAPKSQIGDFDGVPELFETLTAEDDEDQWTTIRFPMRASLKRRFEFNGAAGGGGGGGRGDAIDRSATLHKLPPSINCTVIYLNSCTTNKKCIQYCESMGANSYRWFHDGCCECVGGDCLNYGINESRCAACPEEDEDDDDDNAENESEFGAMDDADYGAGDDAMMWDYGEEEINYN